MSNWEEGVTFNKRDFETGKHQLHRRLAPNGPHSRGLVGPGEQQEEAGGGRM